MLGPDAQLRAEAILELAPCEVHTACVDSRRQKIGAGIAAGIVALAIGGTRLVDDALRAGGDDALRGADDIARGSDPLVTPRPAPLSPSLLEPARGSDPLLTPRPAPLSPSLLEPASGVEQSIENGAASLRWEFGLFSDDALTASTSIACDTIYTIVSTGEVPNAEEWVVIVEDAVLNVLGVDVLPGSAQWRQLEEIKDATADAIIDPYTGAVSEPTANDLISDLAC